VLVMRETPDGHAIYRINLQNGKELLQSPAFYIQQNDVVYVEPNAYRSRQTTVNGNNVLSASFWLSVASLLTSVAILIVK
jgi:polysaccharide export outer membrane protein